MVRLLDCYGEVPSPDYNGEVLGRKRVIKKIILTEAKAKRDPFQRSVESFFTDQHGVVHPITNQPMPEQTKKKLSKSKIGAGGLATFGAFEIRKSILAKRAAKEATKKKIAEAATRIIKSKKLPFGTATQSEVMKFVRIPTAKGPKGKFALVRPPAPIPLPPPSEIVKKIGRSEKVLKALRSTAKKAIKSKTAIPMAAGLGLATAGIGVHRLIKRRKLRRK